jgi:DNA-binding NtrC family response regulator
MINLTALVVDSHHPTAEATAVLLLLHGIRARIAGDTAEAVALARAFPPHAVVTAARLPDGDCGRLIAALRAAVVGSPLVIVTADWDAPEPPPRPGEGVYRFQTPINPRLLLDLIESHADRLTVTRHAPALAAT